MQSKPPYNSYWGGYPANKLASSNQGSISTPSKSYAANGNYQVNKQAVIKSNLNQHHHRDQHGEGTSNPKLLEANEKRRKLKEDKILQAANKLEQNRTDMTTQSTNESLAEYLMTLSASDKVPDQIEDIKNKMSEHPDSLIGVNDAGISISRDLSPFFIESYATSYFEELGDQDLGTFDQFKGKKTTYDENLYTTRIDQSKISKELKAQAAQVEKELSKSSREWHSVFDVDRPIRENDQPNNYQTQEQFETSSSVFDTIEEELRRLRTGSFEDKDAINMQDIFDKSTLEKSFSNFQKAELDKELEENNTKLSKSYSNNQSYSQNYRNPARQSYPNVSNINNSFSFQEQRQTAQNTYSNQYPQQRDKYGPAIYENQFRSANQNWPHKKIPNAPPLNIPSPNIPVPPQTRIPPPPQVLHQMYQHQMRFVNGYVPPAPPLMSNIPPPPALLKNQKNQVQKQVSFGQQPKHKSRQPLFQINKRIRPLIFQTSQQDTQNNESADELVWHKPIPANIFDRKNPVSIVAQSMMPKYDSQTYPQNLDPNSNQNAFVPWNGNQSLTYEIESAACFRLPQAPNYAFPQQAMMFPAWHNPYK